MAAPTTLDVAPLTSAERRRQRDADRRDGLVSLASVTLPIEPFTRAIAPLGDIRNALRRGNTENLRRTYYRALETGRVTAAAADDLACATGRHPVDIWGQAWWEVDEA